MKSNNGGSPFRLWYDSALLITGIHILFTAVYLIFACLTVRNMERPYLAAAIFAAVYIVLTVGGSQVIRFFRRRFLPGEEKKSPLFGNLTLDFIGSLNAPTVICDNNYKVVWYNKAFAELKPSESLYGVPFSHLCPLEPAALLAETGTDGLNCESFGGYYTVKGYNLVSQNKSYFVTVWNDRTVLHDTLRRLSESETMVAYIIVDNLEEMLMYMQDTYRSISSDVGRVLREWAENAGGLLKEYERDKYLFLFSAEKLEGFIAGKFDVLDRIREIRIGEGSLPVTVSIGVSGTGGTLAEKERSAHASLDMALQRGGDQAVIRTESGLDFFGGRTKTIQRRTKVRSRVFSNELIMHISGSSNVLVMGHRGADFDSVGACVGIARLCVFCGVPVNIVVNLNDPNLTKCFEKIRRVPEFPDVFIDSVAAQDMIGSETLLIVVDVNNRTQYESTDVYDNVHKIVVIDHHRKTAEFTNEPLLSYIEPSASSACELVSEILEQVLPSGLLTKEEADLMFAGILVDTKNFARNTGVRTFSAALWLRGEGANPSDAQDLFRTDVNDLIREARFESNVVVYRGKIAISVNDADDNQPSDRIIAAKAADKLLTVEGVAASFTLCRIDNVIHVSARSSGSINVQVIAEKLGGGGHYDAAATQIRDQSMGEVLKRLKQAIDEYLGPKQ